VIKTLFAITNVLENSTEIILISIQPDFNDLTFSTELSIFENWRKKK